MEQKIGIALALLAACALLLYGCTQQSANGQQPPAGSNQQPAAQAGTPAASNGAPAGNVGAQTQPTTGVLSLSGNDTNVGTGDQDGASVTDLPVDDGTDSPVNSG